MKVLTTEEIEKRISDSYELPNNVLIAAPEPMVTVRTSTFQHSSYIRECIEGVLMQKTTFPFEFIIGEDFSTDGTREIVFEYAKNYPDIVRVLTADYNVGAKANGKRSRRAARGKYVALCEGDDYWTDPYKLQKQVDFLEAHPDYSMCFHDCMVRYEDTGEMKVRIGDRSIDEDVGLKSLILEKNISTATIVYRNTEFQYSDAMLHILQGDYLLCILLAEQGKLKFLRQNMSVYRVHAGGIWSGAGAERINQENFKFYNFLIDRFGASRPELFPAIQSKIRYTKYNRALLMARTGHRWKSFGCYCQVLTSRYRMIRLNHAKYLKTWLKSFLVVRVVGRKLDVVASEK